MLLVVQLQTAQDFHRVFDRRLIHVDLLEPANQRPVLFEVVAELLVRGGTDATQVARSQGRFQQVGCIHRAAAGCTRADHRVDLIDEQNSAGLILQLVHHGLQPLLKIAAIAGPGEQRPHVQREDRGLQQHFRHVALDDALGQTFGDRRLAHAGVTHIQRVVLRAAAQDLDRAFNFRVAADQRIDFSRHRLLVQVHAVIGQRVLAAAVWLLLALLLRLVAFGGLRAAAGDRTLRRPARGLRDAMADEIDRIKTGHVLQLQEVDRVAFSFAEQGNQHVRTGNLIAAGGLHVDRGALDDPLEAGGRFRIAGPVCRKASEILVQELGQVIAQLVEIDTARLQHGCGIGIFSETKQKMFQSRIFVPAFAGEGQGAVKRLFEVS